MGQETRAIIRIANTGPDHAFLYSTWRHALWYSKRREQSEADLFYSKQSAKIAGILRDPKTVVRVACLSDDSDMLLGWAVLQADCLKFVYVKIDYRGKGIGGLLAKGFKTFDEPETKIGRSLLEKFLRENHGRKEESQTEPKPDADADAN